MQNIRRENGEKSNTVQNEEQADLERAVEVFENEGGLLGKEDDL